MEDDKIVRPEHYVRFEHEPIDVIIDWDLDFLLGNAVKYIARYKHKGTPLEDLKKALYYLGRKVKEMEEKNNEQQHSP